MRRLRSVFSRSCGRSFFLALTGALGLLALLASRVLPSWQANSLKEAMKEASVMMEEASRCLVLCREKKGVPLDLETDRNRTGFLGIKYSPLTTSLGSLEAKRTTANPNFAGLIVFFLHGAGVRPGDAVAIGASSSFPALIVASLAAARTMKVLPLLLVSLGSSQWGANEPGFHWLFMQDCLNESGRWDIHPVAVSLGGDADRGAEGEPEAGEELREEVRRRGLRLLEEKVLTENVSARIRLYEEKAGGRPIKAFINIGGSWANLGTDPDVLELRPGLARIKRFPSPDRRGMVFEMAARHIPVIHLLAVKRLADSYGLPWDPSPLPRPGEGRLYRLVEEKTPVFFFIAGSFIALFALALLFSLGKPER